MKYPLYGEDGRPEGYVLGYDNDGCPILDDAPPDAHGHPWDDEGFGGFGRAGEDLGPADPADEDDGPFTEDLGPNWHDFEPPDFDDLDAEAADGYEFEPPTAEDLDWYAEHHSDRDVA